MNSSIVEQIYKKHHNWLFAVAFNFTQDKHKADDLIQTLYVKLLELPDIKKLMYGKKDINLYYLYKMIRSLFLNAEKKEFKPLPINEELIEILSDKPYDFELDEKQEETYHLVNEALNEIHWFSSRLLQVYVEDDHSIQSLHEETKISKSTIWTDLTKTKKYIKDYVEQNKTR